MDEMQLRSVAVALRSALPGLVQAEDVTALDADLMVALRRAPGRALPDLRRILVFDAPQPVREWVARRLPLAGDKLRLSESNDDSRGGFDAHLPTVWIEERDEDDLEPLAEGVSYVLVAMASTEGTAGRYADEVTRTEGEELDTTWVLSSTTVRLEPHPADPDVQFATVEAGDLTQWQAVFTLAIPAVGDSTRHRLRLTPVSSPDARLDAVISVGEDVYRRLPVSFHVRSVSQAGYEPPVEPDVIPPVCTLVVGRLAAAHAGLAPAAEWQQPACQMQIDVVAPKKAMVTIPRWGVKAPANWAAGNIEARIGNVRTALERLRQAYPDYFELIEPRHLAADLMEVVPALEWAADPGHRPEPFESAWAEVAASEKLFDLAYYGHELFQAVFTDDWLRAQLARLEPGDRVEISWLEEFSDRVPHLPLPLIYLAPVNPGRPIDPMQFLGMRHRLSYNRRQSKGSRALGAWQRTTRAHLLYWGQDPGDQVGIEAARHAAELRRWAPLRMLPEGEPRIDNLARFLSAPEPSPVSLLYFYCHCSTGSGEDPYLRFGPTNDPSSVLRRPKMGSDPFVDEPIVFVNACGSSESDPILVNQLMDSFLDRGCRAYIGTEGRVPPGLAARFATTFFSFLYGTATRARAPVGESIAQARRFLWLRYRNLGGLFYNYVNDFLIYAAEDEDLIQLRTTTPNRPDHST